MNGSRSAYHGQDSTLGRCTRKFPKALAVVVRNFRACSAAEMTQVDGGGLPCLKEVIALFGLAAIE